MSGMVIGTGVDIVEVARFRRVVNKFGDRLLKRIFTQPEVDYCNKKVNKFQHLAGRFASKEAISKALKIKWERGLSWREIEVANNRNGASEVVLTGQAKRIADGLNIENIHLSISHCQNYAIALAVITAGRNNGENADNR